MPTPSARASRETFAELGVQALSFVTSAFDAPVYNLPIFLFGTYAQESAEAVQSLQTVRRVYVLA